MVVARERPQEGVQSAGVHEEREDQEDKEDESMQGGKTRTGINRLFYCGYPLCEVFRNRTERFEKTC